VRSIPRRGKLSLSTKVSSTYLTRSGFRPLMLDLDVPAGALSMTLTDRQIPSFKVVEVCGRPERMLAPRVI